MRSHNEQICNFESKIDNAPLMANSNEGSTGTKHFHFVVWLTGNAFTLT